MFEEYICYDEMWLYRDMENMAYIFEYCDEYCQELYSVQIDKEKFLTAFMNSECRCEMEVGHPQLLHQAAYNTVEKFVEVDCDNDILQFVTDKVVPYSYRQLYWIGQTYALIHCRLKVSSKKIIQVLPIQVMLDYYYTGHEMGEEVFVDKVRKQFEEVILC